MEHPPHKSSRRVPGRYPPQGTSPIADAIRNRRGEARGFQLSPLDGTLLHCPPIAEGWNSLLGAVRTKGALPGDIRELMILRVAAINNAAFEWIHHEPVARTHGLNTAQLYVIRDTATPLPPSSGILSAFQTAALIFADHNTRHVRVADTVVEELRSEIKKYLESRDGNEDDLLVEAAAIVASYNMVSRFLLSLDVAGMSDDAVPWPLDRQEYSIPIPSVDNTTHIIHAITLVSDPSAPWLVFANSLLTDYSMWCPLVPHLLPSSPGKLHYNILLHSQRGHGLSTCAPGTTIPSLARDIAHILTHLSLKLPVRSVVGVSQGGAAALAFAAKYAHMTESITVCDTASQTPAGNKEAWETRIALALGKGGAGAASESEYAYAKKLGMGNLASATVERWFPKGSRCSASGDRRDTRGEWVKGMVERMPVDGFIGGARALGDYDLIKEGLMESAVEHILLVWGSLDGGGKVGLGLEALSRDWNLKRQGRASIELQAIEDSGHLPMIDETEKFSSVLHSFLGKLEGSAESS